MRNSFNNSIFILFISLLALTTGSFALSAQTSEALPYKSPTPGEFTIVASTVFNPEIGPEETNLRGIEECGFNVCMDFTTLERYKILLGYMEKTKLKLLLHTSAFKYEPDRKDWESRLKSFVNQFKNHPSVGGWNFVDEPIWDNLNPLQKRYELLRAIDPNHFISFNLVGGIVKKFTGPCQTMEAYLDTIQKMFTLDSWSSDYYPISKKNGKIGVNYNGYFTNLKIFSDRAKKTGLPMWTYCQSLEFTSKSTSRPAATLPFLSFEAFSSIAYGAQGLVYWTYWQRPSNASEKYLSALVNLNGKKTKAWYAAQQVNTQIRALNSVFLGAQMVECRHTGMINMKGTYPFISNFGPFTELTNDVKGFLVSHLKNKGHNYMLIVNHDVEKKQKANCKLNPKYKVTKLEVASNGSISRKTVKGNYNLTLSPGGYALFEWE